MLFRSRRLEDLFGGRLDALNYADLQSLIGNPDAAEAEDLDYKQAHYSADDKGREELAKDVTAFANHFGGAIVLGMAEVGGIPSATLDVELHDRHLRSIRRVIASNTAPPVRYEPIRVPNPSNPDRGFLLLAVPRSPLAPHAITATPVRASKDVLRYPRRAGSGTDWLSETLVATAYRDRFTTAARRDARLSEMEEELVEELGDRSWSHLLVALAPEVPGDMPINQDVFDRYRAELLAAMPFLGRQEQAFATVRIGARRLIGEESPRYTGASRAELHRDGAAIWALPLPIRGESDFVWVEPDTVVYLLMSALHFLGTHARDRTAASGTALLSARLLEEPYAHPDVRYPVTYGLGSREEALPLRIDSYSPQLGTRTSLSTQACSYASSHATALLDDLADATTGLVETTALLADELFHAFGIPEARPVTHNGHLRMSAWSGNLKTDITAWATAHNIPSSRDREPD